MSEPPAIEVRGLWKSFRLHLQRGQSLKAMLLSWRQVKTELVWALRDVNLTVAPGETLALVGRNGSGKSTLLGVLSRVYRPTKGHVVVRGRVSSLLELGAGFHPDFTGIENIRLNGAILGISRRDLERRLPEIVAFADLGPYIDAPIKTYSSGMVMRLGFAIAVQTEPDVLLVDEVLAVGDEAFQQKCYRKIEQFQEGGKTILFVSHDLDSVRRVAPRCVWIHEGTVRRDGPTEEVLEEYHAWAGAQGSG